VVGERGLRERDSAHAAKENAMLYTIAVVLLILWLLGFVGVYTIGAFIHVLLVIALVLVVVQLLNGRRVV
jgi:asparagine N-glycosylation enzyme membrane subunit Stt3